ncbi:MAG: hypothetical protein LBD03_03510 [Methanobrevibacter sp.]|jgi:hypothetical protein|nr:hypothetical protein [Candidatus Methanovirga procula]
MKFELGSESYNIDPRLETKNLGSFGNIQNFEFRNQKIKNHPTFFM